MGKRNRKGYGKKESGDIILTVYYTDWHYYMIIYYYISDDKFYLTKRRIARTNLRLKTFSCHRANQTIRSLGVVPVVLQSAKVPEPCTVCRYHAQNIGNYMLQNNSVVK